MVSEKILKAIVTLKGNTIDPLWRLNNVKQI